MIKKVSINDCLVSLEGVLMLEYGDDITTAKMIQNAINALENRYGVTLNKSVYDIQNETQLSAQNLNKFITSVSTALQRLALYNHMCYFTKKVPYDLAEVNYLRYAREEMLSYLQYLLDEDLYNAEHEQIMAAFTTALDNINFNYVRRLFVVMLVLDKLGMYDGATVVAQSLYLGTL